VGFCEGCGGFVSVFGWACKLLGCGREEKVEGTNWEFSPPGSVSISFVFVASDILGFVSTEDFGNGKRSWVLQLSGVLSKWRLI